MRTIVIIFCLNFFNAGLHAQVWDDVQSVVTSDHSYYHFFGMDMASDGVRFISGANRVYHSNLSEAGQAYIFTKNSGVWQEEALLQANDPQFNQRFGSSVSIFGDFAAVGSTKGGPGGYGAVYLFKFDGVSWVQFDKIVANDSTYNMRFGNTLELGPGRLLIGASKNQNANGQYAGSVFIYQYNGTSWVESGKLEPSDGVTNDDFGHSISMSGNRIVVGAPNADDAATNVGAAYAFEKIGPDWVEIDKLQPNDLVQDDHFGMSVDLDGDYLGIGAYLKNTGGTYVDNGAVYTYKLNNSQWSYMTTILSESQAVNRQFGKSLSLKGELLVIGAVAQASIYRRVNDVWTVEEVEYPNPMSQFEFGFEVEVFSESSVLVSDIYEDEDGITDCGVVHHFTSGEASIFQLEPFSGVCLAPNPFENQIKLIVEDEVKDFEIGITDVEGRLVFTKKYTDQKEVIIDLNVKSGVYLVTVESKGKRSITRIVKE